MRVKDKTIYLSQAEHVALVEALRRRSRFGANPTGGEGITEQWTGLGTATTYKAVVSAGFMVCATSLNRGHITWWRLTQRGAAIIRYWMDEVGYDFTTVEAGRIPPVTIPVGVIS